MNIRRIIAKEIFSLGAPPAYLLEKIVYFVSVQSICPGKNGLLKMSMFHLASRNPLLEGSTGSRNCGSLLQPISTYLSPDGANFTDFVTKYLNAFRKPYSIFYMNWLRINDVFESLLDNIALIQSTAIEGVLKEYFKKYGNLSDDEKASICNAMELVIESDNKIKERIVSKIRDMEKQNARKALEDLMKIRYINSDMYNTWKSRNKLAHGEIISAGGPEDQQKALDESNAVLSLFYRLLFIHIGYSKKFYDYSQKGHHEMSMNVPRETW